MPARPIVYYHYNNLRKQSDRHVRSMPIYKRPEELDRPYPQELIVHIKHEPLTPKKAAAVVGVVIGAIILSLLLCRLMWWFHRR